MKFISNLLNRVISSSLFRTSGIYTITASINAGIPLLLLPVLTTKLSPEDYGIIAMFQLVTSLLYPIFGMNLESSIARKYFDETIEYANKIKKLSIKQEMIELANIAINRNK